MKLPATLTLKNIKAFYMSSAYPVLICAIVLIGNFTGLELYFNTVNVFLTVGALLVSDSIRPFIISLCTCYMQASVKNSPFYPTWSDYFKTGWRLVFLILMIILVFAGIAVFVIRNKIYKRISLEKTPTLLPLLAFSLALLLNGAFSNEWSFKGIVFALVNILVYLLLFLLIYHGFSDSESGEELAGYFAYITMLISLVISLEMLHLFITRADRIFVDGAIMKDQIALGWGIWNLVGVSLSVLTPVIFYGMHKNKYPWLYFSVATLGYIMSVLTMSRNSLIFSSLAYAACVIVSCFVGKNKKAFRVITGCGVIAAFGGALLLWSKLQNLLADYFERGFSDNGRFDMWRTAFDNFLDHPIFGNGFYGLRIEDFKLSGPVPLMAHNFVIELLSAMGIVGLLAYAYYAASIFKRALSRPNLLKMMLAFSMALLIVQSLLDNFVFNIYPVFHYTVAAAIICKADGEQRLKLKTK